MDLSCYSGNWRHYDGVHDATYTPPEADAQGDEVRELKAKEITRTDPDYLPLNTAGSNNQQQTWMVWNASDETFSPTPGGVIDIDEGGKLTVGNIQPSPHGHWIIATTKRRQDVE